MIKKFIYDFKFREKNFKKSAELKLFTQLS